MELAFKIDMARRHLFLAAALLFAVPSFAGEPNLDSEDPLDRLGIDVEHPTQREIEFAFNRSVQKTYALEFPEALERLEAARRELILRLKPTTAASILPENHGYWQTGRGSKEKVLADRFDDIVRNCDRGIALINKSSKYSALAGAYGAG